MGKQRKTLEDLYVDGREFTVDDGTSSVTVWLQKVSPIDHETCIRRASAARARLRAAGEDADSDTFMAIWDDIHDYDAATLVEYVVIDERRNRLASIEAELELGLDGDGDATEWGEDGYLAGLRDAWVDDLSVRYAEDPEDEEAARVFAELKRFTEQVDERLDAELAEVRSGYDSRPLDELRALAIRRFLEIRASSVWLREFERSQLFFAVRNPVKHEERHFDAREAVDRLDERVLSPLLLAYREMTVDVIEGKDSAARTGSSPSSEQPAAAATDAASGLDEPGQ